MAREPTIEERIAKCQHKNKALTYREPIQNGTIMHGGHKRLVAIEHMRCPDCGDRAGIAIWEPVPIAANNSPPGGAGDTVVSSSAG